MALFNHQRRLLLQNPTRTALVWETGTGKTRTSIEWADPKGTVLIICPKGLVTNWHREIAKWAKHPLSFTVMSKENFRKDWDTLEKYDAVIIDEVHYFLGIKSQMHKNLCKYLKRHAIQYRLGLSATVYMSTPLNIMALGRILGYDGYEWSYPYYMQHFFVQVAMGNRLVSVIRANAEEEVSEIVNSISSVVKLADCADVPEDNTVVEYFALNKDQERAIKNLTDIQHIVRWTKTHQICGGTLKGDEYTPAVEFTSQKIDRLKSLALEHKKLIVVCRYNHELDMLQKQFPNRKTFLINGSVQDKQSVLDEANKTSDCILFVNAACSEGWSASTFDTMVFYSYDFSLKNYIQMKGRIQRINALQKCNYISLVIDDTIDQDVWESVTVNKTDFHMGIYNPK